MKKVKILSLLLVSIFLFSNCSEKNKDALKNEISIIDDKADQKVDVFIDSELFTSYIYTDKISNLKKTTLFPIVAANGVNITRGFPLAPRPNERIDHPHHIGAWLNYGDVNGLDFWGHSDETPLENKDKMGVIRHDEIVEINNDELIVTANWLDPSENILLTEKTKFNFQGKEGVRIIDRTTTLTATDQSVLFNDTKEGMFAIRVARQLEHPSENPVTLSDAHGGKTNVPVLDNKGVTGHYLSSEGIEGVEVWGKRAKWVSLDGTVENKDVTVAIFDNPQNIGHPTYWHARGYGLFAANPLGQNTFSEGKEELNLSLKPGESVTFKYRILILDGISNKMQLETEYNEYVKEK